MKTRKQQSSAAISLEARIKSTTRAVEELVIELKRQPALRRAPGNGLLAPAAASLERAARALKTLAAAGKNPVAEYADLRAVLEGTSPLMSHLGSRVVLASAGDARPAKPSSGAQALALLLEDPSRSLDAGALARQLDCSVPMARTTLNRLVQSGHAVRAARGLFRAKAE